MPEDIMTNATADVDIQQSTEQVASGDTAHVEQPTTQTQQERMFKQSELDAILEKRLAKEKQRFEGELKSNPHLSYLEQKAQRLGLSVEQLIENDRKYEEQEKLNNLIQQNIPEEYAKKLLKVDELEKWKTETEKEKSDREAKETAERTKKEGIQKQVDEFDQWYFKKYGKMADLAKDIPKEVFQANMKGVPLLYAYKAHLLEQSEGQQQTQQANQANATASTGSVKSSGMQHDVITEESINAHADDTKWMIKNYDKVTEFYSKKKKG